MNTRSKLYISLQNLTTLLRRYRKLFNELMKKNSEPLPPPPPAIAPKLPMDKHTQHAIEMENAA